MHHALRDLIISLTPEDGSSIGNGAMLALLRDHIPDLTEEAYAQGKDALIEEGVLGRGAGVAIRSAKADQFVANVLPIIRDLQGEGLSLRRIAATLNERGVKAARGGRWHATTVRNIVARAEQTEGIAAE